MAIQPNGFPGSTSIQAQGGRTRVGGSAFTVFTWNKNVIGYGQEVSTVSPTPVGGGATPIQPMDTPYAIEIVTPAAQNIGTVTFSMIELYNQKVWEQLQGLAGAPDLVNIFIRIAAFGLGGIQGAKIIQPPVLTGVNPANVKATDDTPFVTSAGVYGEIYNNLVITNVEDGETINIGTQPIQKRITMAYTYITVIGPGGNVYPNAAIDLANGRKPQTFFS